MFIFSDVYKKVKASFDLDRVFQVVVMSIIVLIVLRTSWGFSQSINSQNYNNVIFLSTQENHPHTQAMARHLLQQDQIRKIEYFKLMRAQQQESHQVKEYPAIKLEDQ